MHLLLDNDDTLKLQLKDMALEFSWPVGRIKEAVAGFNTAISSSSPTSCPAECLKSIGALVEEQNIPEAKIGLASGVSAFLWLYSCVQGCVCYNWLVFCETFVSVFFSHFSFYMFQI